MNEQLQKIAEDAGVDARTMGFESNQHHRDPWNARLEKFAELIVKECISKYEELEDAVVIYRLGGDRTGEIAKSELIKEHFGVER